MKIAVGLMIVAALGVAYLVLASQRSVAVAANSTAGPWHVEVPFGVAPNNYESATCVKGTTTCWVAGGHIDTAAELVKSTDGGTSWSSQSPAVNVASMGGVAGISCPTTSHCVVAGSQFLNHTNEPGVATSSDGGTSWTNEPLPASVETSSVKALTAVSCGNAQDCVAVGGRNSTQAIVTSTNGGSSWTARTSPSTKPLDSVSCPDGSHCFAVGNAGTTIASTNGGSTWTTQTSGTSNSLLGVSCPDATHCWAVGASGTIVHTIDGGTVWTPEVSGTSSTLNAVFCTDDNHCVTVGNSGTILYTTNGGVLWAAGSAGTTARVDSVACYSTTSCLAGTHDVKPSTTAGSLAQVLRSTNGGASWSQVPTNNAPPRFGGGFGTDGISCGGPTTCFAVGATGPAPGGPGGIVRRTTDGIHWSTVYTGGAGSGGLWGISCPDTSHCVAVGSEERSQQIIIATSDGGATWHKQTPPAGVTEIRSVSCPDASHCFATTNNTTILATTNGGSTWTTQTGATGGPTGISCPDDTHCFAVNGTTVEKTTNGSTWTSTTASPVSLDGISCHDDTHCVGVGETGGPHTGGKIAATTNGGTSWSNESQTVPTGENWDLYGVSCVTDLACTASGGTGTHATGHPGLLFQTTNGGSSWTRVPSIAGTHGLPSVACTVDACWAAGGRGVIASDFLAHTLTVTKTGNGKGTVTSSPAGIDCGSSCSYAYGNGTKVTLTAKPASHSIFAGWSGAGCKGTHKCTVTLTSDQTVKAKFLIPPKLKLISAKPHTYGVVVKLSCSGSKGQSCRTGLKLTTVEQTKNGKVVSLSASGKGHKVVVGSKSLVIRAGRKPTTTVYLNATGKALLATFHRLPMTLTVTLTFAGKRTTVARRKVTITEPSPPRFTG